jgi:uncharacterized membrane protein
MSEEWHLAVNGEKSGPHSVAELQAKLRGLDLNTMDVQVWAPSTVEWVHPRTVPGLVVENQGPPEDQVAAVAGATGPVNPYATPQTEVASPSVQYGEPGNHPLEVGRCVKEGWNLTTSNLGKLVLFGLVYIGIAIAISIPIGVISELMGVGGTGLEEGGGEGSVAQAAVSVVLQVIQNLVSMFLGIGAVIFGLNFVQRKNPEISDLFAGWAYFGSVLLATIMFLVIVAVGFLLLIIPGIYMMMRLGQFQYAIVDRKLSAMEGLKASWEMTRGNVLNLIGLWFVLIGIIFLGIFALLVGLIWAYPTVFLASVAAYQMMAYGANSLNNNSSSV